MAVPRFYVSDALEQGATGVLDSNQSRQARSVLRLTTSASLILFNDSGVEADARIVSLANGGVTYEIIAIGRPDREPNLRLTVGLALLKGDRFEVAVQKLTELGVARIAPMLTERSVVSFDDARGWQKRSERYARIAREAAEQSERVTLPVITAPVTLAEFLRQQPVIVLLERAESAPIATHAPGPEAAIAVGPEGGWSDAEQALIVREAAGTASLGRLILRAETAAIVAAGTVIQRAWEAQP
ncbi:MAG TPA: RsmE family RNA methyltransferase [Thermomicrobiales bacterium]|nr:RsmE family RNA methyltransferase [Thermomicrobiales bacterium]